MFQQREFRTAVAQGLVATEEAGLRGPDSEESGSPKVTSE
jgi:hypothetical protein